MRFPKVHGNLKQLSKMAAASATNASCPTCKTLMGTVSISRRGCYDPEGIRNDRECKLCGLRFGYSKAGRVKLGRTTGFKRAKAKHGLPDVPAAVLAFRGAGDQRSRLGVSLAAPKGVWISADGRETPIAEMATTHLANTLRFLERFAKEEVKRELGALQCLAENIPGAVSPEQFSEIERMTPAAYCEQRVAKYRELSAEGRRRGLKVVNGQTVPRKAAAGAKR